MLPQRKWNVVSQLDRVYVKVDKAFIHRFLGFYFVISRWAQLDIACYAI